MYKFLIVYQFNTDNKNVVGNVVITSTYNLLSESDLKEFKNNLMQDYEINRNIKIIEIVILNIIELLY